MPPQYHEYPERGPGLKGLIQKWLGTFNVERQLIHINRRLRIIMSNQAELDTQVATANAKLDDLATAIQAEADQVAAFIASQPAGVDTSALNGVIDRLSAASTAVSGIFTPPA